MHNNNKKIMSQIINSTKDKDDSNPYVPPICGVHLVEADLTQFEHLMNSYKIPQAKWPGKLYPALHGKTLKVYHQMQAHRKQFKKSQAMGVVRGVGLDITFLYTSQNLNVNVH